MRRPDADEAARFVELSNFLWYQRFDLGEGIATPGVRDVDAALDACEAPRDMSGLAVLDVGTTNGGVSFEAERRGARRILATDIYPASHYGFDQVRALLGACAEFRRLSVYELDQLSEVFDVVFLLGVLYHLRHPLLAIDQTHAVLRAGGRLYVETEVADWKLGEESGALFYRDESLAGDPSNWWSPTTSTLRGWLETSGFAVLSERAWPKDGPRRAAFSAERVEEVPLYQRISYEVPLTTRTVPAV